MVQDTLIYIDDSDRLEAEELAGIFANKTTRNRAYINVLGSELAMKYLASENIKIAGIRNLHSIRKILEEFDISDIMLSNIHIDVRVVFDENIIFIPKSHFEYNLVPDIYLVLNLSQDKSNVKFLGFFEPKLINKNNANNDYYFIEKEKLNSSFDLKQFIENYKGNTSENISEDEMTDCKRIIMDFSDNDISDKDKKYLLSKLTKSLELRDEFLEFENFELLSHAAMTSTYITKKEIKEEVNFDAIEQQPNEDISNFDENIDVLEDLNLAEAIDTSFDNNTFEAFDNDDFDLNNSTTDTNEFLEDATEEYTESDIMDDTNTDNMLLDDNSNLEELETSELEENSLVNEIETSDIESFEDVTVLENLDDNEQTEINENIINLEELPNTADILNEDENESENFQDFNSEEDLLTLDNEPEEINTSLDDEIIDSLPSLENLPEIGTETNFEDDFEEDLEENLLSIENVEVENEDFNSDEYKTEIVSFDEIETKIENEETIEQDNSSEITEENFDIPSIENIENINENLDEIPSESNLPQENTASELIESQTAEDDDENIDLDNLDNINDLLEEEVLEDNNETFGKNLLENLALEDDVTIQTDDDEEIPENTDSSEISIDEIIADNITVSEEDNIETGDLISQIDDILNTVEDSSNNEVEEITENEENSGELETSIVDLFEDTNEQETEDDKLNLLFSETEINPEGEIAELNELEEFSKPLNHQTEEAAQIPGGAIVNKTTSQKNTKPLIIAAAILLIAGGLTFTFLKQKSDTNNNITNSPELPVNPPTTNVNENTLSQNTPNLDKISKEEVKEPVKQELKNSPIPKSSESYLSVDKLVWNAPNNLYYNPKFQNYLQTAGKSIKLSLSADLLLATEYAYTNLIKVDLTLNKDGNVENAKIASSSGSEEIDKIVLQSVKDTLNVVKPPSNEIQTPNFNLSLNIYL